MLPDEVGIAVVEVGGEPALDVLDHGLRHPGDRPRQAREHRSQQPRREPAPAAGAPAVALRGGITSVLAPPLPGLGSRPCAALWHRHGGSYADQASARTRFSIRAAREALASMNPRTSPLVSSGSSTWGTWPHSGRTFWRERGSASATWRLKPTGTSGSPSPQTNIDGGCSEGSRVQKPSGPKGSSR